MKRGWDLFFEIMEDLWLVVIIFVAAIFFFWWLSTKLPTGSVFSGAFYYLLLTSPVWLVALLGYVFWDLWMTYLRSLTISEMGTTLLEIKLPQEILKSPLAMEVVFSHLYQTGAASYLERFWQGKIRPWFSLELVSLGGAVHFYIWTDNKYRDIVEAQMYAQYPNIVIEEAEDYAPKVIWDPEKRGMWGTYFKMTSEVDAYPIKTYVDYGLDRPGAEEEEKIDPLTAMLEYLGSLKPHEQAWVQILIKAHKKEGLQEGHLFERPTWKEAAKKEIEKIRKEATPERPGAEFPGFPNPTKGQVEKIAAIERSISKFPFETIIRGMYVAEGINQFGPASIPGLIASIRQYNSQELNGFRLGWFTDHSDFVKDLNIALGWIPPWNNYMQRRRWKMEQKMLDAYKKRSIFYPPYQNFHAKPYILNTEELATMFHIPGRVAATPTLQKIESKRGQAPTNLPL